MSAYARKPDRPRAAPSSIASLSLLTRRSSRAAPFFGSQVTRNYVGCVKAFAHVQADLSGTPAIANYMRRCAARPAFAAAFGPQHAALVEQKTSQWLSSPKGVEAGPADMLKKMFG